MTPSRTRQTLVSPSQPASERPSKSEVRLTWLGRVAASLAARLSTSGFFTVAAIFSRASLSAAGSADRTAGPIWTTARAASVWSSLSSRYAASSRKLSMCFKRPRPEMINRLLGRGFRRLAGALKPLGHCFVRALVFFGRRSGELDGGG